MRPMATTIRTERNEKKVQAHTPFTAAALADKTATPVLGDIKSHMRRDMPHSPKEESSFWQDLLRLDAVLESAAPNGASKQAAVRA